MGKLRNFIALTALMSLCISQVQCQGYDNTVVEESPAYSDSEKSSYLSAAIPIGALVVVAIIIATTSNHHHHSSSSSRSSSSSFVHSDTGL